jgi:acetyl esterase
VTVQGEIDVTLHPQAQGFLVMAAEAGQPRLPTLSAAQARAQAAAANALIPAGPEVAEVRDLRVPVRDGEIGARLYEPSQPPATIVWFHGGGWVVAGLDSHDAMCRNIVDASGCRLVSIDYRLAPEHPFPTPLEDCWDALRWAAAQYAGAPIVVGGDSAGGNMAAVCAVRARDAGAPSIASQVLVYPVTDADFETESYVRHGGEETLLGKGEMVWFFDHYTPAGTDRLNPEVSPLRYADLAGVAPAIVVTDEYDPLRDEGLAYVARLGEAGVAVTHHHYGDMFHGFFSFPGLFDTGTEANRLVGTEVRAMLGEQ